MDKEINKRRCCAALRAIMQYRDVSMADVASGTKIPYGTVANYYYGRNSLPASVAYNVVEIEHFLDIDGRILTGSMSIEQFYEDENRKMNQSSKTPLHDAASFSFAYILRNPKMERLKRMMAYYQSILDNWTDQAECHREDCE